MGLQADRVNRVLDKKLLPRAAADEFVPNRIVAIVVGIEDYRSRPKGEQVAKVHFARNDAQGFAAVLQSIYPNHKVDLRLMLDSDATISELDYVLKQTIDALEVTDLFVFYYAGHGFHGEGGNRVTGWDSTSFNIGGSTRQSVQFSSHRGPALRGGRWPFSEATAKEESERNGGTRSFSLDWTRL